MIIAYLEDEHFGYTDQYATYWVRKHKPIRNDDVGYPARCGRENLELIMKNGSTGLERIDIKTKLVNFFC
ncbi:uncharacterized protein CHSO_1881 [Chryseobacterium sp. StRB126]|nr:uncharacterized protein CHSO_1881 [Chryseobacterium sp. StRB126]